MIRFTISRTLRIAGLAVLAAGCAPDAADKPALPDNVAVLVCEGGPTLRAVFSRNRAVLEQGGVSVAMIQQRAASGIWYKGGGQELRGKGYDLTWTDKAGKAHTCRDQRGGPAQPQNALSGTNWKLLRYLPAQGVAVVPPRVERYAIHFQAGGTLAMQLDCNRGTGRWQAQANTANSGTLTVTGGAMTRAMCPDGAIDSRIARDTGDMRGYRIENGNLTLTLADGGAYVWTPG